MDVPETLTIIFSSSGLRRSLAIGGGGKGLLAMGTHPMAAARAKGNQAATDAILPPLMLVSPLWGAILMAYAGRQVIVPVVLVTTSTTVASVTSWNFFFSFFSAMLLLNSIFYDFLCFFFNTEHAYTGHTHTALQIQQVANLPLPLPSPPLWLLQQELATLQLSLVSMFSFDLYIRLLFTDGEILFFCFVRSGQHQLQGTDASLIGNFRH